MFHKCVEMPAKHNVLSENNILSHIFSIFAALERDFEQYETHKESSSAEITTLKRYKLAAQKNWAT